MYVQEESRQHCTNLDSGPKETISFSSSSMPQVGRNRTEANTAGCLHQHQEPEVAQAAGAANWID